MNLISNVLYWISTGLLVPVILLLIYFFLRALLLVGVWFGQYLDARRTTAAIEKRLPALNEGTPEEFVASLPKEDRSEITAYLRAVVAERGSRPKVEMLVSEYELLCDKRLSLSKTMTKMGPILGLMGTLIPMGPALVGLATGDIASMAYNMQVAFATTVVGLVISAIGFITQQTRERWYVRYLTILEYVAEVSSEGCVEGRNEAAARAEVRTADAAVSFRLRKEPV